MKLDTPHERLVWARRQAGFSSAAEAADSLGIPKPTYSAHENGSRGFGHHADHYAARYKISLEWLLTGRGHPKEALNGLVDTASPTNVLATEAGHSDVRVNAPKTLNREEVELISLFRKLNSRSRNRLISQAKAMRYDEIGEPAENLKSKRT